jgi:hypothetical protein
MAAMKGFVLACCVSKTGRHKLLHFTFPSHSTNVHKAYFKAAKKLSIQTSSPPSAVLQLLCHAVSCVVHGPLSDERTSAQEALG